MRRDADFCNVCGRLRQNVPPSEDGHQPCRAKVAGGRVRYYHDGYGCDSGCCGHRIVIENAAGDVVHSEFEFTHNRDGLDEHSREIGAFYSIEVGPNEFYDGC